MPNPAEVSVAIEIDAPAAETFALAAGARLPDFVRPLGLLPGVARVEGASDWRTPGEKRRLTLTDGSSLNEELTGLDRNRRFAYRATAFTGPFGALVAEGNGEWRFEAVAPQRTRLVWTYAFTPKSAFSAPLVSAIASILWPRYMRATLERLKATAERAMAAA